MHCYESLNVLEMKGLIFLRLKFMFFLTINVEVTSNRKENLVLSFFPKIYSKMT